MSKRRMFSHSIVESDAFLDMPLTSQALYFHLCLYADDDGFVNPKRVMRMIGANGDDLQILLAKRFILSFETGIVVIKHWHINNMIRSDRYAPTTYEHELSSLVRTSNNSYTEKATKPKSAEKLTDEVTRMATNGRPDGNQRVPQYSIGKYSIGKVNSNTGVASAKPVAEKIPAEIIDGLFSYWTGTIGYEITGAGNRKACAALVRQIGVDKLQQLIKGVALSHEDKYAPRISDFVSLKRKYNDLILWGRKAHQSGVEVLS